MSQLSGTNDYITAAIEKHSDMVRRICFLYLKNNADVEDVFQEVFLKFFQNYGTFESEAHQKSWLCRVTFNQCKDFHKSFWRKNVVNLDDQEIPYELPEQSELTKAVLELPSDQKEIVYLHYYEGRPIPEIAEIIQMNQNTAYSLLRRAKTRLKKKVSESL